MKITHVLRGEDLLPSTPRQIVLYDALKQIGVGSGRTPAFGHLPSVLGEGNRRLSKRDKDPVSPISAEGLLAGRVAELSGTAGLGDR